MKNLYLLIVVFMLVSCNNVEKKNVEEKKSKTLSNTELSQEIVSIEKEMYAHIETDTLKAGELIGKYIHYANTFKEDTLSPEYLLRASEVAANIGQAHNAVNYLKRIESDFPSYNKYGFVLYYTAHIYDYFLKNPEMAAEYYNRFITDYPNHILAEDAKMMLQIIELSDIELIRQFESLNE
jgi:tetratricopeptide (TPR) repeat protein